MQEEELLGAQQARQRAPVLATATVHLPSICTHGSRRGAKRALQLPRVLHLVAVIMLSSLSIYCLPPLSSPHSSLQA